MYLVTGGAGFIGSNIVAALAARGARVVVSDWLESGDKWRNLAKHAVDRILRPEQLTAWLAGLPRHGLAGVVHMGAISSTTETDGDRLAANNIALSQELWQWCAARRVPFVYASSAATYGDGAEGFDDDWSEPALARLRPLNGYGWSKHFFDRWAVREVAAGRPRPPIWAGLKFFNVYGPNEYHKGGQRSVAHALHGQIAAGEAPRLFRSYNPDYPDGGQIRDFVQVEDCVKVTLWLLDEGRACGIFNVGSGRGRSFLDLARAVSQTMGKPDNVQFIPMPESLRAKYQYFTEAKMERLRDAGYRSPFLGLEEGVARYLRDHLMQEDPYR